MKFLFSIVLVGFFFCSFGSHLSQGQDLTEEDIASIVDAITVRQLEIAMLEGDQEIHSDMIDKLDRILDNQAGFQAIVTAYIVQENRRQALRDVIRETRGAVRPVAFQQQCRPRRRGLFAFFGGM